MMVSVYKAVASIRVLGIIRTCHRPLLPFYTLITLMLSSERPNLPFDGTVEFFSNARETSFVTL